MSLFSWLRNRTSIRSPRGRGQHRPAAPRFRPQLEALEDRCVPSTLTVTNNLDYGYYDPCIPGSLRYEIGAAQSGDTIVFDKSIQGKTITLDVIKGSELYINKSLTIQGPGANHLAISGGNKLRVFEVAADVQLTLSGLTIENGDGYPNTYASGFLGNPYDYGGGIVNYGTLTLSGCIVSGNFGQRYGGGIANFGTMTLSGCTVSHNSLPTGGTRYNGGGIYNDGTMTLSGSTVTQNTQSGINNDGVLTILSSDVKANKPYDIIGAYSADSSST